MKAVFSKITVVVIVHRYFFPRVTIKDPQQDFCGLHFYSEAHMKRLVPKLPFLKT